RKGEGGVVMIFIKNLIEDVQISVNGDGTQTRDFIYVEDVADINISAIDQETHNGFHVYNISSGVETSINQLYDMISKKLEINTKPIFFPATMGEISRSCLDNSLAKKELNTISLFSLKDGIDKTIRYLKS
ncbi:MAG TPA: NAD-dependent epimerase/dehydratase family protein, partial [Ignavibacteria bacterium]|nr:NAD-dependent epimerase/dehydratase family protein [Ignavibacteria bacterium]